MIFFFSAPTFGESFAVNPFTRFLLLPSIHARTLNGKPFSYFFFKKTHGCCHFFQSPLIDFFLPLLSLFFLFFNPCTQKAAPSCKMSDVKEVKSIPNFLQIVSKLAKAPFNSVSGALEVSSAPSSYPTRHSVSGRQKHCSLTCQGLCISSV